MRKILGGKEVPHRATHRLRQYIGWAADFHSLSWFPPQKKQLSIFARKKKLSRTVILGSNNVR
jgi:hypothetical protein